MSVVFLSPISPNSMDGWSNWWSPSLDTQPLQRYNDVKPPTLQSSGRGGWGKISAEFKRRRPGQKYVSAATNIQPATYVHPFKRAMHFTFYSKTSTPRAFPRLLLIASLITGTLSQDCRVCPLSIFLIYHFDQLLRYSLAFRVKPGVNLATTYILIFLIQSI